MADTPLSKATPSAVATTTGTYTLAKDPAATLVVISLTTDSGGSTTTFTGASGKVKAAENGIDFANTLCNRNDTGAQVNGGTTFTLSDNTNYILFVPAAGLSQVRWSLDALSTGSLRVTMIACSPPNINNGGMVIANAAVAQAVTSTSATAFAVGPNGTTNPAFVIDDSTSSAATGLKITPAAAGSGVALQAVTSGTNEVLLIDAAAAALVKIGTVASTATGLQVGSSTSAAGTQLIVQSVSAAALTMGRLGATTPAFVVDASTSTCITGIKIKAGATTTGVALSAVGEASNGALKIDAQGSGAVIIGDTSTGPVYLGRGGLLAPQIALTATALGTVQSSTPTSAQLLGGLITQSGTSAGGTVTLPTGTALSTACNRTPATGDSFTCNFCSITGGQTLTLTGATGTAIRGTAAVAAGKNATMLFCCTGANTWDVFCNVSG